MHYKNQCNFVSYTLGRVLHKTGGGIMKLYKTVLTLVCHTRRCHRMNSINITIGINKKPETPVGFGFEN